MEELTGNAFLTVSLRARRRIAPGIIEIRLSRPAVFVFFPGQFVCVVLGDCVRNYTMVSDPHGENLDFCIAVVEQERFSRTILDIPVGSTVHLTGPHGHFVYQGAMNPAVFMATGGGIPHSRPSAEAMTVETPFYCTAWAVPTIRSTGTFCSPCCENMCPASHLPGPKSRNHLKRNNIMFKSTKNGRH